MDVVVFVVVVVVAVVVFVTNGHGRLRREAKVLPGAWAPSPIITSGSVGESAFTFVYVVLYLEHCNNLTIRIYTIYPFHSSMPPAARMIHTLVLGIPSPCFSALEIFFHLKEPLMHLQHSKAESDASTLKETI